MKRNLQYLLYLLFAFFFISSCNGDKKRTTKSKYTYTQAYDLGFKMVKNPYVGASWRRNAAYMTHATIIPGKYTHYFGLTQVPDKAANRKFEAEFEQFILLPSEKEIKKNLRIKDSFEATVKFVGFYKDMEQVTLDVFGLNEEEKTVQSNYKNYAPKNGLDTITVMLPLDGVDILGVRISCKSSKAVDATIGFDRVIITLGSKDIDKFPLYTFSELKLDNPLKSVPINLGKSETLEDVNLGEKGRFIALGKSVDGSQGVEDLIQSILLHEVHKGNCKLIIIDQTLARALCYNNYILNRIDTINGKDVVSGARMELFQALRAYNKEQKPEDQVKLFGYGAYHYADVTRYILFDYVVMRNATQPMHEMELLADMLMDTQNVKESDIALFIENNQHKLSKLLFPEDLEIIPFILRGSEHIGSYQPIRTNLKSKVLFDIVRYLEHYLPVDKQAYIVGKLINTNFVSKVPNFTNAPPFGQLMEEHYKDQYTSLAILLGNGKFNTLGMNLYYNNETKAHIRDYNKPPTGSVEDYLLEHTTDSVLYFDTTEEMNRLAYSRFANEKTPLQQFYPFNLKQRYNGVFFVRNSDLPRFTNTEVERLYNDSFLTSLYKTRLDEWQVIKDKLNKTETTPI